MIQICREDKEKVYNAIREGHMDAADMAFPNLIDSIVLAMKRHGFLEPLSDFLIDKRRDNHHIPFDILMTLGVTAKLRLKTSLTDVPFAVNDAELLAEMGWNIWDNGTSINEGLFSEGVMRKLISKYTSEEWVSFYNHYVQDCVVEKLDVKPCIHILDCTKIPISLENENYEEATVVKLDGESFRGYKLGVLRGLLDDSGIVEEIVFGTIKTHDMEQCREMFRSTACFKENDILINDRGFLSREMTNYLKTTRSNPLALSVGSRVASVLSNRPVHH